MKVGAEHSGRGREKVCPGYLGVSKSNKETWLNMFLCSFIHSFNKHFLRPILGQTPCRALKSRYEQWKFPVG